MNIVKFYNQFSPKVQKAAKFITASITIITVLTSIFVFAFSSISNAVDNRIEESVNKISNDVYELNQDITAYNRENKLSITRLELITLIKNSPDNITEIEKLAKYYFIELGGDSYMTSLYSEWATKYGAVTYFE